MRKHFNYINNQRGVSMVEYIMGAAVGVLILGVSIIVFTDGTDQAARYSREEAYAAVENASEEIKYYTIGLGNEIDAVLARHAAEGVDAAKRHAGSAQHY